MTNNYVVKKKETKNPYITNGILVVFKACCCKSYGYGTISKPKDASPRAVKSFEFQIAHRCIDTESSNSVG